jgi:hypothetical protein
LKWGLIPYWMKAKPKPPPINAKTETVAKLPIFRRLPKAPVHLVSHDTVNHSRKEYVRGGISTNTFKLIRSLCRLLVALVCGGSSARPVEESHRAGLPILRASPPGRRRPRSVYTGQPLASPVRDWPIFVGS